MNIYFHNISEHHYPFLLELFQKTYSTIVKVSNSENSIILVESTDISESLCKFKDWKHTYQFATAGPRSTDTYSCILSNSKNYRNTVNISSLNTDLIAKYIRNVILPKPFPLLEQIIIICNPEFEPERYARCVAMCKELGLSDDNVTYICPTYKHMMTPEIMSRYVTRDLVKTMRPVGTKRGDVSLCLNWLAVMEHIVTTFASGMILVLESDAFPLSTIHQLNDCLGTLEGKRWDCINIGGPGTNPFAYAPYAPGRTPYRATPNIPHLLAHAKEDLSTPEDALRFVRYFATRCTDSQLWSYQGCEAFYKHISTDQNYAAPIDYYITQFLESNMDFKYYWSSISYFDQRSNLGLEPSSYQGDAY